MRSAETRASYWALVWRKFRERRSALGALYLLGLLAATALFAPLLVGARPIVCRYRGTWYAPFLESYAEGLRRPVFQTEEFRTDFAAALARDPESWALWPLVRADPIRRVPRGAGSLEAEVRAPPSLRHPLGTDDLGVDVFAQLVFGTRTALLVGCSSMAIAAGLGIVLGAAAGYFRGFADFAISRLIELTLSIPTLVLFLAFLSVVERPTAAHLVLVIGLTRWDSIARLTRGEFLKLRRADFVLAARGLGAPWHRIVFSHILPNAVAPAIVPIAFGVANAILLESGLSFLGYGVPLSTPSWGRVLASWGASTRSWWLAVFPSLAIFASVLTFNLIGDGFREAIDPRSRRPGR